MRRVFLFITVIVGGFFIIHNCRAVSTDLVINEIGAYEAGGYEWVEIYNKGEAAIDLSGWKFWEYGTAHKLKASSTDALVDPGEYAVIVQDEDKFLSRYPDFSGSVFDSSWGSLKEAGEEIGLLDDQGEEVEKFIYLPAPDYSLERIDVNVADYSASNWQEHASGNSVGQTNSPAGQSAEENIVEEQVEEETVSIPEQVVEDSDTIQEATTSSPTSSVVAESQAGPETTEVATSTPTTTNQSVESSLLAPATNSSSTIAASSSPVVATSSPVASSSADLAVAETTDVSSSSSSSTVESGHYTPLTDLAQVRQLDKGEKVKVSGLVSVLPGVFASQYFYITDNAGGLPIYSYKKDWPALQVGDYLVVTGEISQSNDINRVKIQSQADIEIIKSGQTINIIPLSMANLSTAGLGGLVKVVGVITESKSSYIYLDDGTGELQIVFKSGAQIDKSQLKVGNRAEITGVLEKNNDQLQLWPRSDQDVELIISSYSPKQVSSSTKIKQTISSTNSLATRPADKTEKYLITLAGGAALLLLAFIIRFNQQFIRNKAGKLLKIFRKNKKHSQ